MQRITEAKKNLGKWLKFAANGGECDQDAQEVDPRIRVASDGIFSKKTSSCRGAFVKKPSTSGGSTELTEIEEEGFSGPV